MKKIIFLLSFLVAGFSYAQESAEENESKSETEYNKFSIEAGVGLNRPDDNFTPGYFSSNPNDYFPLNDISHFNLGVRYMFNERFGLKLDGAYDIFEPQGDNGSRAFETNQIRVGLQGVVNLRNLLNFHTFSGRLGLLGHAGVQVSFFSPESREDGLSGGDDLDQNGGFIFGLTPQFRLSDRFVITADASFIQNYRSHRAWDGEINTDANNLRSSMVNVSLGLTVYLGKHDVHADWVVVEDDYATKDDINMLKNRLDDIEKGLKDDDNDGVPNYLDKDPNTPAGAIVNSKGQSVDTNGNGIPDAMEGPLDAKYKNMDVVKELANKGVIAVYFDFDVAVPQENSYSSIKSVLDYMNANKDAKLTITGYADEIGTVDYNNPLSAKRAKKVYDILVSAGVDASRVSHQGGGVDDSVDKNSEYARQLVRRATFTIE